jgi:hypothetical protein
MKSLHPKKNRHERNLGRAAWRDKIVANESRREITNPYFPGLRCGQWLLQGALAKSKLLTAMIEKFSQSSHSTALMLWDDCEINFYVKLGQSTMISLRSKHPTS